MRKKEILKLSVREEDAKRPMVTVYNDKCFWVENGPVLSNIADLARALAYMTDAQYEHHANRGRNDFARWMEEVLADPECAASLRRADGRKKAAKAVERRLKDYQ